MRFAWAIACCHCGSVTCFTASGRPRRFSGSVARRSACDSWPMSGAPMPVRSSASSMRLARWRASSGGRPKVASSWRSRAASGSAAKPSSSASSSRFSSEAPPKRISGSPAESSMVMFHRRSSTLTRRASWRSGVTRQAERPGVSRHSRRTRAAATACSWVERASTSSTPFMASATRASCPFNAAYQRWDASAGRISSLASQARGPGFAPISATICRVALRRASSCFIACCGWVGPTAVQLASSMIWSRPGSTTAPLGRPAMALSSVQVAGMEPVEPAAMKGLSVRVKSSRFASRLRIAERRACGPMASSSARRWGYFSRAIDRNSRIASRWRADSMP